jgi:hypothetical protein
MSAVRTLPAQRYAPNYYGRNTRRHIATDDECWENRRAAGNLGSHAPACYELTLGGTGAARLAYWALGSASASADAIYAQSAALLGLYAVAFYGERAQPGERRKLRAAWCESMRLASGEA